VAAADGDDEAMTIARDFTARPGSEDGADLHGSDASVPALVRADRLAQQVAFFERAGYHLETGSGFQAVVVKPSEPRPLRAAVLAVATAGLWLLPGLLGAGKRYHRVVISVDRSGSVRLA
jgi:hypothetical protein